ncbi:MAG: hypothetical protein LBT01_07985, partial [Spirochaetaceae bacterium]|nr:hypothetical protein [Spirochaetaceae bacterium]
LCDWAKAHEEFSTTKKRAQEEFEAWYEDWIIKLAKESGRDHDAFLAIWLGKNKCGWRDRREELLEVRELPVIRVVAVNEDFPAEERA